MKRLFAIAVLLAGCHAPNRLPPPEERPLAVEGAAAPLPATFYAALEPVRAGIVLVHRESGSPETWAPFAARARLEGCHCLAVALEPGILEALAAKKPDAQTREKCNRGLAVITAGKKALLEAGAPSQNIGIAGEGLGANLALVYAVEAQPLPALLLVSPSRDFAGEDATALMAKLTKMPVALFATEGDSYGAQSAAAMKAAAAGFCELRMYPGSAYGADLFSVSRDALEQAMQWVHTALGV